VRFKLTARQSLSLDVCPMRGPRIILLMVALVVAFACLAPSSWFFAEPVSTGASTAPPDAMPVVLTAFFLFFLACLFVPRLRPRWGWHLGFGVVWTRSGWRAYKETAQRARMNFLNCFGILIGLAGIALEMCSRREWVQSLPSMLGTKVILLGALFFAVGAVFTRRGDAQTKTTDLHTGKTIRRRGYHGGNFGD
jgi:drug/metabolite transporter (DMT)-like permease